MRRSIQNFDAVLFDDGIGETSCAMVSISFCACSGVTPSAMRDIEELTLAHVRDAVDSRVRGARSRPSGPAGRERWISRKQRRELSWEPRLSHGERPANVLIMKAMTSRPPLRRAIGVFDSGVGGLTVLQALRRRMPHRDFVYLGDTARVPYGRKPPEMVVEFATGIARFPVRHGRRRAGGSLQYGLRRGAAGAGRTLPRPVWGVIDPGVEAATRVTRSGSVGVIGTKGTDRQRRLPAAAGSARPARMGAGLPHAGARGGGGLADSPEAELLVRHYLSGRPKIDTLVLGCTHYPLLRGVIQRAVGGEGHPGGQRGSNGGTA